MFPVLVRDRSLPGHTDVDHHGRPGQGLAFPRRQASQRQDDDEETGLVEGVGEEHDPTQAMRVDHHHRPATAYFRRRPQGPVHGIRIRNRHEASAGRPSVLGRQQVHMYVVGEGQVSAHGGIGVALQVIHRRAGYGAGNRDRPRRCIREQPRQGRLQIEAVVQEETNGLGIPGRNVRTLVPAQRRERGRPRPDQRFRLLGDRQVLVPLEVIPGGDEIAIPLAQRLGGPNR